MATETLARTGQADETNRLISSQKVDGTAVYNRNGDSLGDVDHMMIDKYTGQVEYVVLSCGGFLGMGEEYSPLPWKSLTYDTNLGGYVIDADKARLGSAPRYKGSAYPDWSDRSYTDRVNQYWGVRRAGAI
jgi:sporulation protein YlmC with PRC-barrel domain